MAIQFKDIESLDHGALFLNVDLHIHSYGASADVKDATLTPEAIVDSAVAQGLSVIAITDHNADTNVARAQAHARQYAGKLLVLPGVEVTTAHGHLLVYFAPEKAAELTRFLAKLDLVGAPGAAQTHTAKSMADVLSEAHRFDAISIAAHIDRDRTGFEMLAAGYPNWKRDIVMSPGLYGMECDSTASLVWYSDMDVSGADGSERTKMIRARVESALLRGRSHLAHVQNSDSHSMAHFNSSSPDKRWTRMKMNELSFGAFRTALIDPTARVVAKAAVPRSFPRVRGMVVTGGFLDGEHIRFSDNLNCFIGGRGTGKSTAIRSLAYCFGLEEAFGDFDSCPDSVVVYCEDSDGILYRYERPRHGDISVRASKDDEVVDAPIDSFRIEYFGQGELAKVAEDPLKAPHLLQGFLDRHINLHDLTTLETSLVGQLKSNASVLIPLRQNFEQLDSKQKNIADIDTRLALAEAGKLRDIVGLQSRISAEKSIRTAIEGVATAYSTGLNLAPFQKDFGAILVTAGLVTTDATSVRLLSEIDTTIETANTTLSNMQADINNALKDVAGELVSKCADLKVNHAKLEAALAPKIADLKAKGLAGNIAELEQLLKRKAAMLQEVNTITQESKERLKYEGQRKQLLEQLKSTRAEMTTRRKSQLADINNNLARTITDYKVFLRYQDSGIIDMFLQFLLGKLVGTYVQEDSARQLCERVAPSDLAGWVLSRDVASITKTSGITPQAAQKIQERLCEWSILLEMEALSKPAKPEITVLTKSVPSKSIPIAQLSDGQRHTILLTIAMLAESNIPLVIDQPEDDLDNAFIFSSIVSTLRTIKERRQVILITHNANIAVLGDSELLLPMRRENDRGRSVERGSIDRAATRRFVQDILEGGPEAFRRRQEIYGH